MNGFWGGRFEKTFVDVCVFNPSNSNTTITSCYKKNMKTRRKGHMIKELERWSMQRLHPSFFQLPVVYIKAGNCFLQASGKSPVLQDQPNHAAKP